MSSYSGSPTKRGSASQSSSPLKARNSSYRISKSVSPQKGSVRLSNSQSQRGKYRIPFGKYKGQTLKSVLEDSPWYIETYILENNPDILQKYDGIADGLCALASEVDLSEYPNLRDHLSKDKLFESSGSFSSSSLRLTPSSQMSQSLSSLSPPPSPSPSRLSGQAAAGEAWIFNFGKHAKERRTIDWVIRKNPEYLEYLLSGDSDILESRLDFAQALRSMSEDYVKHACPSWLEEVLKKSGALTYELEAASSERFRGRIRTDESRHHQGNYWEVKDIQEIQDLEEIVPKKSFDKSIFHWCDAKEMEIPTIKVVFCGTIVRYERHWSDEPCATEAYDELSIRPCAFDSTVKCGTWEFDGVEEGHSLLSQSFLFWGSLDRFDEKRADLSRTEGPLQRGAYFKMVATVRRVAGVRVWVQLARCESSVPMASEVMILFAKEATSVLPTVKYVFEGKIKPKAQNGIVEGKFVILNYEEVAVQ